MTTRTLAGPTVPGRFYTCPPNCPECVVQPRHQDRAYWEIRALGDQLPFDRLAADVRALDATHQPTRLQQPMADAFRDAYRERAVAS